MIEVGEGDYVRTDKGTIAKIEDIEWDILYSIMEMKPKYKHWVSEKQCYTEYIVKHSKNLIDLIECGDIVEYDSNNYGADIIEVVVETCTVDEDYEDRAGFICTTYDSEVRINEIKSILTHEEFEMRKYKVKEN